MWPLLLLPLLLVSLAGIHPHCVLPLLRPAPCRRQAVFNQMIVALSGLVGITTTVILFCAHFHQVWQAALQQGWGGASLCTTCGRCAPPFPRARLLAPC